MPLIRRKRAPRVRRTGSFLRRGQVIVEVKELTTNEDDLRQLREMKERGWTHGGGTPGGRVFEKIKNAAPQLKARVHLALPCVLVFYDNIRADDHRLGAGNLDGSAVDFGIYGLQQVLLSPREPGHGYSVVGTSRGGRRQMSNDMRVYISAIQVLLDGSEACPRPHVFTFHNYFARLPLSRQVFRGPGDRHFEKPRDPGESPQQ